LFVAAGEADYSILDEDELEIARDKGLISADLCGRILAQLDQLTQLLEHGQFGAWLRATCPASFDLALLTSQRVWLNQDFGAGAHDGWPEETK
jgi:predicted RNA-binding protein associated with RNAse of E/G family